MPKSREPALPDEPLHAEWETEIEADFAPGGAAVHF
jgi:hypothetical protein